MAASGFYCARRCSPDQDAYVFVQDSSQVLSTIPEQTPNS